MDINGPDLSTSVAEERPAVDFAFLAEQTVGDEVLEHDLLALFSEQARRLLPTLPTLKPRERADTVHLLKGSCLGIGAWTMAEALQAYEEAAPGERHRLLEAVMIAMAQVEDAIDRRRPTV